MNTLEVSEKRHAKRVDFKEPIGFQFKDPTQFGGCLGCDLSESGLRVNFSDFVPLGTELLIQLTLAGKRVVERMGKVVWVQKFPFMDRYQVGLQFLNDRPISGSQQEIKNFVELSK